MFEVNFNDQVKVKLTDYGLSILQQERESLNKRIRSMGGEGLGPYAPKTDEEGYTTFQIWDLMNRLGAFMALGKKVPFEGNMIFPSGKVNEPLEPAKEIKNFGTKPVKRG